MGNFMGYSSATELFTAIGNKIKAKYTKPSGGIPKSDLATAVQTSLGKADNAVQPATMTEALAAKQNSLSETQLAAVNSGINSTKVAQISTNQTNILSVQNKVGKNLLDPYNTSSDYYDTNRGIIYENNKDGTWKVSGTSTANDAYIGLYEYTNELPWGLKVGDTLKLSTNSSKVRVVIVPKTAAGYGTSVYGDSTYTGTLTVTSAMTGMLIRFTVSANGTVTNENVIGMICREEAWNLNPALELYGVPNSDLTQLEAEDRAALADEIDAGAKNKLQNNATSNTIKGVTFTVNSDGSISTYGTSNAGDCIFYINQSFKFESGVRYVLTGCPSGGSSDGYRLCNMGTTYINDFGDGGEVTGDGSTREIAIYVKNSGTNMGTAQSPKKFYPMICTKAAFGVSQKFVPFGNDPFYQVPINHNMIYRGRNLGATLTDAQHTALSGGNFTDLYLGDYWTKTVTIPAGTYTGGDGEEVTVPAQTNITLKAVIADFDTFYAGYASTYAGINTHHAAVIVTGFSNVVWNGTNSTAGGYVNSLIHKWLVDSALPQIETWFGSAKVLSHQKLLTNAITGDAASGWAWSSQKISLLSENQMYGSKVWGGSKATNGGYEPGEAFKHLNVFNHIDANLLFGNKNIWLRDIASAVGAAHLHYLGYASHSVASNSGIAPAALILLS